MCVTVCGIMHPRCRRPPDGNIVGALYPLAHPSPTRAPFTYCSSFNRKRNTNGTFVLSIITFVLSIITFVLSIITFVLSIITCVPSIITCVLSIITFVLSIISFVPSIFTSALDTGDLFGSRPDRYIRVEGRLYIKTRRLCGPHRRSGNCRGERKNPRQYLNSKFGVFELTASSVDRLRYFLQEISS